MKHHQGFTLIETIIYLALFAIIIGGGMLATYQIIEDTNATQNHIIVQEEANFLFRKIDWALTGATAVSANGSNLTISKPISGILTPLTFNFSGNNLTLQRNSGAPLVLNSSSIAVTAVLFTKTTGLSGAPASITTDFTLTSAQNGRPATQSFSFTKMLDQ